MTGIEVVTNLRLAGIQGQEHGEVRQTFRELIGGKEKATVIDRKRKSEPSWGKWGGLGIKEGKKIVLPQRWTSRFLLVKDYLSSRNHQQREQEKGKIVVSWDNKEILILMWGSDSQAEDSSGMPVHVKKKLPSQSRKLLGTRYGFWDGEKVSIYLFFFLEAMIKPSLGK